MKSRMTRRFVPKTRRQKGNPGMRRLGATLAASALVAVFAVPPAYADHNSVSYTVLVKREFALVAEHNTFAACSGVTCGPLFLTLNNRDYGRYLRWCGTDTHSPTVLAGNQVATVSCTGPSTWNIEVQAILLDCTSGCDATTHSADVTTTGTVAKP